MRVITAETHSVVDLVVPVLRNLPSFQAASFRSRGTMLEPVCGRNRTAPEKRSGLNGHETKSAFVERLRNARIQKSPVGGKYLWHDFALRHPLGGDSVLRRDDCLDRLLRRLSPTALSQAS